MKQLTYLFIAILSILLFACTPNSKTANENTTTDENPPAAGFNQAASDEKAIHLADATMKAMGGRAAWDKLHYVAWNFFGARDLVWDKQMGRVRIDFPRDSSIYLINVNTMEGKVLRKGEEMTQPDSLKKYLGIAKSIWINDSYWLVMPFKLKDSGTTLKYLRQDTIKGGATAEVVELTFENVGDTPNNKYEVFIDKSDTLVKQWAFFREAAQDTASAVWPWDNYKDYNGLMLSGDRSDDKGPKNIRVYDTLPNAVFESFEVPELK